ncbi:hypothetical protein RB595_004479 [Gaeumannomyces hyphopodioides]
MAKNRVLRHFNGQLALAFAVIAVSTFNYGFDNAGYATTQAMEPFQRQFGEWDAAAGMYRIPPYWLSLFNSLNFIGFAAGVIIGSLIMEARVLNYIYIGIELAVVPVYRSEIMPREIRGFAVGSHQFSLMFGTLIVNLVCRGTSSLPGNEAWQIPFGLFFVIPVIVIGMIFFIPESPRWLLTKDRPEEARASLAKLRGGVLSEDEIDEQFEVLRMALDNEPEQGKFKELFQGRNLKRTAIVVAMNFFQQATGQAFASTYGAIFIRDIGTVNPFTMNVINAVVNLCVAFVGLYLPYAALGSRVGFIFAGIIALAIAFTWLCVLECKGKSLEQVDRLFNEGVSLRKFGNYKPEELTAGPEDAGEKGKAGLGVSKEA